MADVRVSDLSNITLDDDLDLLFDGIITGKRKLKDVVNFIRDDILELTSNQLGTYIKGNPADTSKLLELNGGVYSKADYPELVAHWDSIFGVNGSNLVVNWYNNPSDQTKFRVLNLYNKGRFFRALSSEYGYNDGDVINYGMPPITGSIGSDGDYGVNIFNTVTTGGAFFPQGVIINESPTSVSAPGVRKEARVGFDSSRQIPATSNITPDAVVTRHWVVAKPSYSVTIPSGVVDSFNGRTGAVAPLQGDYTASQVNYNNIVSNLLATNVQEAIDELLNQSLQTKDIYLWTGSQTITADTPTNLLSSFVFVKDPLSDLGTDIINNFLKFPDKGDANKNYVFKVRYTGTIAGSTGVPREFILSYQNSSGVVYETSSFTKESDNILQNRTHTLTTWTKGSLDPLVVDGASLVFLGRSNVTLTSMQLTVFNN